jgi:Zn-dependent protease
MSLIERILIWIFPVVFAITVHEIAHGWAALRLGDQTAIQLGRLSLNPLRHIDPIGSILVPGVMLLLPGGLMFGWAKPVPVDTRKLHHPRRDMVIVALAGPFSNLLMLLAWAFAMKTGLLLGDLAPGIAWALTHMGAAGIIINAILMMLNLLPVPPLDGSQVVAGLLPPTWAYHYQQLGRYGLIILILLLASGILSIVLWPLLSLAIAGGLLAANISPEALNSATKLLFGG